MYPFFVALHVALCLFLITVILLQPGKGGDVGAAFGGGGSSSSLFGPRGPTGLLQRATTFVAILFMATSVTLALYSNRAVLSDANVEDELQRLQELEREGEGPAPAEEPTLPPEAQAPKRRGR
jgi:preprotein translocase subunit SecG